MAVFLDNFLSRLRKPNVAPTKTLGVSGTAVYGGEIQTNERNQSLTGTERYRTFSDILANVSIVAAGTRYFLNLLSKADWTVQPATGDGINEAEAEKLAMLVEEMMHDMTTPWFRVVRRAAMYRFYGFSIQEWTAKRRDDGILGMMDVEPRPQATIDRWDVDISGTVHGIIQDSPQSGREIYIPRGKIVYLVDDTLSDSPEGIGIFRHLAEPAARLQELQKFEAYGYEMDLRGVPILRAPIAAIKAAVASGEMSGAEATAALADLQSFLLAHSRSPKAGLLLDSAVYMTTDERQSPSQVKQYDLETVQSDSADSAVAVGTAIERLNRELARILGVEHLLLGGDGAGSLALSRDKTNNFGLLVDSSLMELRTSMENDFLGPIWRINGWDEKLMPTFRTEQIQYRDIEQITAALKDMAIAGLTPDDPAINEVRRLLGLSDAPEVDEDLLSLITQQSLGLTPEPEGEEAEEVPPVEEEA